jgi:hypothetical protein
MLFRNARDELDEMLTRPRVQVREMLLDPRLQ